MLVVFDRTGDKIIGMSNHHVGEERVGGLQVSALQAGENLPQTLPPQSRQATFRPVLAPQDRLSSGDLIGQDGLMDHFLHHEHRTTLFRFSHIFLASQEGLRLWDQSKNV